MKAIRMGVLLVGAGVLLAGPQGARAQTGLTITPLVGAYTPAGSFQDLREQAGDFELERKSTLGLGLNVGLGLLRASVAYASGATISRKGVDNDDEIGDGSVLVGAADIVLRPLPKLIVLQPYVLGGIGYKKEDYSFDESGFEAVGDGEKSVVLHAGVGVDISLGRLALVAEITDFIGRDNNDKWKVHDAFGMVGLKFNLF